MSEIVQGDYFLPTNSCFDDSFDLTLCDFFDKGNKENLKIVHGIVWREELGEYAHSWVEFEGHMYEVVINSKTNEKCVLEYHPLDFHQTYKVIDNTKYSFGELMIAAVNSPQQNSGPFKIEYLKKCKDWEEIKHLYEGVI